MTPKSEFGSSEFFFLEIFTRNDRIYPYKKPEWDFTSEIIETSAFWARPTFLELGT